MWEVHPTLTERRLARNPIPPPPLKERRIPGSVHFSMGAAGRSGWLAIQSSTERRRVADVPEGWSLRTDEELRELLDVSESTGKRRRLIE